MTNHLKRIASPRTWVIDRKKNTFIVRPKPGAHPFDAGLPLGVILRDELKLSDTLAEAKKILNNKEVLVDGKRRKDYRYLAGLFDLIAIPEISKYYRVVLDKKGRLSLLEVNKEESQTKLSKIVGKTALRGGKIQFNLHDGKNIVSDEKAKVNDTLVLNLSDLKIKKVLPLKEGVNVFLTKGKYAGYFGVLKEIKGKEAIFSFGTGDVETAKKYLFVVGENKSEIKLE